MDGFKLGPVQSCVLVSAGSENSHVPVYQLDCSGPQMRLAFLAPGIVRVRFSLQGDFAPRRSWDVTAPEESFAGCEVAVQETREAVCFCTAQFTVQVKRTGGLISFQDVHGREFCADAQSPAWENGGFCLKKSTASGEHFYGFGERGGLLEKTGRIMNQWTTDPALPHGPGVDPLYIAIPYYLVLRPGLAYGVFLNTTYRSRFDLSRPGVLSFSADGGELDYYLFYGPTPAEVLERASAVMGRMPLPPLWALGFHQSRWSYDSEERVLELAAEFRRRDIPCDVIHLDIDYMDGYRVFTWNQQKFPHPERLTASLRKEGFRVVTIIDPGVKADPDYFVYQEGLARDAFVRGADGEVVHGYVWPDDSVWSDYTRPAVRQWWGDLQKKLVDAGISGIWNDMNEPAVFGKPFSQGGGQVGTLPLDAPQGDPVERTVHAEVHNLYGSGMAQASYEGLRRHGKGERPFALCRSGFAGIQRWTASWMGDNDSWWEHLEMSLPQLMNMGLSAVPFVGVDIGGFGNNATPELFARWVQAGILYPFCRAHSSIHTIDQEPWAFGPNVEAIARKYLKLRYRLLPYLYSLFWKASQSGEPILRPLLYDFPEDVQTYCLHDELMFGPSLLAAPVVHPGREHRAVYLPEGAWYDFWTGARYEGPTTILADAPIETMPLFVRAGSILPLGPEMVHTAEKPLDELTLELYPGDGEFILYEDDGHTFGHEQGQFCKTHFHLYHFGQDVVLQMDERQGAYVPAPRRLVLHLHDIPGGPVQSQQIEDDGKEHMFTFKHEGGF